MRRCLLLGMVTAALAVAVAHSAEAALFLIFNRNAVPIGSAVSAHTPIATDRVLRKLRRSGSLRRHPLRVFLAARADAASVRSVRDSRLTPLGPLHVDRRGRGRLTFSMPNVAPGDYTTFLQCVPCRPGAPERALVPSGPFPSSLQVVDGPPVNRDCSTSGRWRPASRLAAINGGGGAADALLLELVHAHETRRIQRTRTRSVLAAQDPRARSWSRDGDALRSARRTAERCARLRPSERVAQDDAGLRRTRCNDIQRLFRFRLGRDAVQ